MDEKMRREGWKGGMTYTTGLRPIHELGILLLLLGDGGWMGGYNFFSPEQDRTWPLD